MNDQFTVMAEDALRLAKKTARNLKLNYVGTEHILMGLILEDGSVASRILIDNGIDESRMMDMIKDLIVPGSSVRTLDRDGFSPRAEKVLEDSHIMSERFKADKTGTEHILLALIKEGENVAVRLISTLNVPVQKIFMFYLGDENFNRLAIHKHGNLFCIDGGCALGYNSGIINGAIFLRLDDMTEFTIPMA